MIVNDIIINADLIDILVELRNQLNSNHIDLLKDIVDSGDNIMVTCIYHKDGKERKPSAGLLKDSGIYHCFTCNTSKSFVEFISNCFGYDDYGVFGTQWIIKNFYTVGINSRKDIKLNFNRNINTDTHIEYISEQELDKYRYYHPYMYERKLNNDVIERFDIGYDKETDCITFPIRDINGNTLFVARRSVKTKYFHYPSGVKKPVYGHYELLQLDEFPKEVIICESMLDALHFWVIGKYAVALNGLGSNEQYIELNKFPCRKFILATDNDIAGFNARVVLRKKLSNKLITEYVFPNNRKDAGECTDDELRALKEIF